MSQKRGRKKKESFEEKLARLEAIVNQLERGGLELDKAMKLFREGTALVNELSEMLRAAELEIVELTSKEQDER